MGFVHLDQQRNVGRRVFAGKGHRGSPIALGQRNLGQSVALPARHQAGYLRPAVATGAFQIPAQHPALALTAPRVVKPIEYPADVTIALRIVAARRKLNRGTGTEKSFDLLNRAKPLFVHVDHHPLDDQPSPPSPSASSLQAHSSLEIRTSFRLTPHWTRLHVARLLELPQHSDDQLAVEMLVVLRDWLLGHIARSDRAAAH